MSVLLEQMDAINMLEGFASHFGPDFYGLPRNEDTVTLRKRSWTVPAQLALGSETLTPLGANRAIAWQVEASS